tara:strand:- start:1751 stop:2515 length:765 start_codon:yes stop_codon:yes gene_type:complete
MKLQAPAILKNKYVLYVLLVLAIINVLGYVALQDYDSLALFVAVGVLSTYFSKNMAVNLLLAIAVTSLIAVNKRVLEGMKNKEDDDEEEKPKKKAKKAKKGKKEGMKEANNHSDCNRDEDCPQGKRCNSGQCVDTFQNNVPPSSPASVDEDDDEAVGDRIDYAATMEQAYDNLQTMLGDDGIKSITSETKKLVNQQKDLMKTLNSMAPVLNTAKETLSGMDLPNIGEMGNLLKKLNGSAPDLKKLGKKPSNNDA